VLGINKTVEFYRGNPKSENMLQVAQPDSVDLELEKDAVALFQTADDLYMRRRYCLQPEGGFDRDLSLRVNAHESAAQGPVAR